MATPLFDDIPVKRPSLSEADDLISVIATRVLAEVLRQLPNTLTPTVNVAAPAVTVTPSPAPVVNVTVPEAAEVEPPEIVMDLSSLTQAMDSVHTDLAEIKRLLLAPVTKTVHRGSDDLINTVIETRNG